MVFFAEAFFLRFCQSSIGHGIKLFRKAVILIHLSLLFSAKWSIKYLANYYE